MAGLGFFAAKTATHAAALHPHRVVVQTQRMRHPMLHFAGMLGAAVDQPLALRLGYSVGHLAFEVKVLLPAHFQAAAQRVLGRLQARLHIAPAHKHRRQYIALRSQRLLHRQHGGQGFNVEHHFARSAARLHHAARHHQAHDLTNVLHRVARKNRFVPGKGREHGVARNVLCQQHRHHTGHSPCGARVNGLELAVGHGGQDGRRMQGALQLGHVVDVGGGAGHLGAGAFMRGVAATCREGWGMRCAWGLRRSHACNSKSRRWISVAIWPWLSSQKRQSKLPST